MLKLKDNVDLKLLEKFGFKKHKRDNESIIVSKWIREICYGDFDVSSTDFSLFHYEFYSLIEIVPNPKGDKFLYFNLHYDYHIYRIVDILYKLIKFGLIEDVRE